MKQLWVKVDPYKKKLVTTALESGADAVWVPAGRAAEVKALGLIKVVAPDGDLIPGRDMQEITVTGQDQEAEVVRLAKSGPVVVRTPDWTVIPLENLVAQSDNLFVEVMDQDAAKTALGVLEKGVDGLVVVSPDPAVIKDIARLVKEASPPLPLEVARITALKPLGMGDRVCVDTCSNLGLGEGMLVGNAANALFLVHAESLENPYVAPRPFRVNAGPVHAYIRVPAQQNQVPGGADRGGRGPGGGARRPLPPCSSGPGQGGEPPPHAHRRGGRGPGGHHHTPERRNHPPHPARGGGGVHRLAQARG